MFKHLGTRRIPMRPTSPDLKILPKFFDAKQIRCLWMRMASARSSSPLTVQKAWEELKGMTNVQQRQRETLVDYLVLPPGIWQQKLLEVTDSLRQSDKIEKSVRHFTKGDLNMFVFRIRKIRKKKYYISKFVAGELEQIHGIQEADEFISKGKYAESEDSDGDIVYRKVTKQRVLAKECVQEVAARRSLI